MRTAVRTLAPVPSISDLAGRYRRAGADAFERAIEQNDCNIEAALRRGAPHRALLDLGCDDGRRTMRYAAAAGATDVHGVETVAERAAIAAERGVVVVGADLGEPLPFEDARFDAVVSNQVIEHLYDTDIFVSEALRVLRPGGRVAVSTENLASWHNVGALVMGWQPFSLTNVSCTGSIGNPLGLHAGGDLASEAPAGEESWQHRRVFAARGLVELLRAHGFDEVELLGAGYYPLPRRVAMLNPAHAAFITATGRRPL